MASPRAETASLTARARATSRSDMTLLRGVGGLLLFIVAIGSALAFLMSAQLLSAKTLVGDTLFGAQIVAWTTSVSPSTRVLVALGSLVVGVAALYGGGALIRGVSLRSKSSSVHVVEASEHGLLVLDNRSVAALAQTAAARVQGIYDVEVIVQAKGVASPVRLEVRANVIGGVDLREVGRQASKNAREAVERLAGLSVADVTTRLSVEEPRRFLEDWS